MSFMEGKWGDKREMGPKKSRSKAFFLSQREKITGRYTLFIYSVGRPLSLRRGKKEEKKD